jgi:hypothetical protein
MQRVRALRVPVSRMATTAMPGSGLATLTLRMTTSRIAASKMEEVRAIAKMTVSALSRRRIKMTRTAVAMTPARASNGVA